ncbi:unnamed protein product [Orchesella dallaii]|uniref:Uncharacterized protein n=1 Tax=Orchesella dallaii TaxID=48710 RepID=A0ABP1RMW3_9HEXA
MYLYTLDSSGDNLKSLLEEVNLKFENLKLASSERELALEIRLSKLKEEYKNDKLSANNQIAEIEAKLKAVTKRSIELLNENLEISTKLKESEEIRTNVVQTAKPNGEVNGQLIDFVNVDSTLAETESYENGEEIQLEQVSGSTARSASPPFTRRTPPPRHYQSCPKYVLKTAKICI